MRVHLCTPPSVALHKYPGLLLLILCVLLPGTSRAEWYVGAYGGWSAPESLKDVKMDALGERNGLQLFPGAGSIPTSGALTQSFHTSDLSLKHSSLFGGKAGYFFADEGLPWLGVELEAFTSQPTIKSQTVTTTHDLTYIPTDPQPPGLCLPGINCLAQQRLTGTLQVPEASLRLITVAFNVVARYPGKVFQPYAGVGVGAFYFKGSGAFDGRQVVPGLNAMAGVKIFATEEWGLFLEGKFNRATLTNFDPTYGLSGEYSAFNVLAGIAYHF